MYFMSVNKLKQGIDRAQFNSVIAAHREWVKKLIAGGALVQAGKWGDSGGMIIVKAGSREEADGIVNQDPLVLADMIAFETAELPRWRSSELTGEERLSIKKQTGNVPSLFHNHLSNLRFLTLPSNG